MTAAELTVEAGAVRSEALTWPERARATSVVDADTYTAACALLKGIKALRQRIAETFDPHITRAFQAHRALCKEKADAETPLTEAERILKRAIGDYDAEQERIRAEAGRQARETARRQEEQRRLEEAAALEMEAQRTNDAALQIEAEELIAAPVETPTVIVPKATPKVAGITYRDVWKFRVTNAALVPREYTKVDDIKLGGVVRAHKGQIKIPGVEIYCEKVVAAGSR